MNLPLSRSQHATAGQADWYRQQLERNVGIPLVDGNQIEVLNNGDEIFPAMMEAIEASTRCIDFLTFVYWRGDIARRFADALAARARDGVRVRVLLDAFGCRLMPKELVPMMRQAGVEVRQFRPLSWRLWRVDKRTHRKILVCDEQIAFTGGVGIAEEWEGQARHPGEWRDIHARLVGPVIAPLRAAFLDNWNEVGPWSLEAENRRCEPLADGVPMQVVRSSSSVDWTDMATLVRTLIAISRHRLHIATPYFAPDSEMIEQLCAAADRGVDVQILIAGQHNDSKVSTWAGQRSYGEILGCGIRIHRFDPTMMHTKLILVDDQVTCLGSANLNHRSMGKDEECCVVVLSQALNERLNQCWQKDLERAHEVTLENWRQRGWLMRLRETVARLFLEQV